MRLGRGWVMPKWRGLPGGFFPRVRAAGGGGAAGRLAAGEGAVVVPRGAVLVRARVVVSEGGEWRGGRVVGGGERRGGRSGGGGGLGQGRTVGGFRWLVIAGWFGREYAGERIPTLEERF